MSTKRRRIVSKFLMAPLLLGAITLLAQCGKNHANNPDYFSFSYEMGKIKGEFNPKGWTVEAVTTKIGARACEGLTKNFEQKRQFNGLMEFTAECVQDGVVLSGWSIVYEQKESD